MPELRRLRCFVAVATERNFTRAAERLHVAQPALSRQVRLLELGVELLRRTTREVTLTDGGRYLLERAPALPSATDDLWRSVRSFAAGEQGSVTLGYGTSAGRVVRSATAARRGANCVTEGEGVPVPGTGSRGAKFLRSSRAFRNTPARRSTEAPAPTGR